LTKKPSLIDHHLLHQRGTDLPVVPPIIICFAPSWNSDPPDGAQSEHAPHTDLAGRVVDGHLREVRTDVLQRQTLTCHAGFCPVSAMLTNVPFAPIVLKS